MRITLQTHGGIAAALHRKPVSIETDSLHADIARHLKTLVESAVAAPAAAAQHARPDAMSYTLTIEDGANVRTLKQRDAELTPEFSNLLAQIAKHGQ
jgi:hypothetical protein